MTAIMRRYFLGGSVLLITVICVSATNCIPIADQPTLEGTWAGTLTAEVTLITSASGPADLNSPDAEQTLVESPVVIAFDADGVPDKLIVYQLGPASSMMPGNAGVQATPVEINAVQPGETTTITLEWLTYTITVREASYRPAEARVVLDMVTSWDRHVTTNTSTLTDIGDSSSSQTVELKWVREGPHVEWSQMIQGTSHSLTDITWRNTGETVSYENWGAQQAVVTGTLTQRNPETMITGTWSGELAGDAAVATSNEGPVSLDSPDVQHVPFQTAMSVTFDVNGVPNNLIAYGLSTESFWGPATAGMEPAFVIISAVQPGNTSTFTLDGTTHTVTVREAEYTPDRATVVLDTTMEWHRTEPTNTTTSDITGTGTTVQTIEVTRSADGTGLQWVQTVEGSLEATRIITVRAIDVDITHNFWSTQRIDVAGVLPPEAP